MIVNKDTNYVVEINEGIYLTKLSNGYGFTKDVRKATLYERRYEAWQNAKECGGTDKQYVITHEVLPCNT